MWVNEEVEGIVQEMMQLEPIPDVVAGGGEVVEDDREVEVARSQLADPERFPRAAG
jgi:hypothetical protein